MCFNCNHRREVRSHHPPRQAIRSSLVPSTGRSWRWWGSRSTTPKILRMHILWLVWLVLYFFLACGYMVLRELLCIILYFFWGVTQIWVIQKTWEFTFHLRDLHLDFFYWSTECICLRANRGGNLAIFIVLVVNVFILAKLRTTYLIRNVWLSLLQAHQQLSFGGSSQVSFSLIFCPAFDFFADSEKI